MTEEKEPKPEKFNELDMIQALGAIKKLMAIANTKTEDKSKSKEESEKELENVKTVMDIVMEEIAKTTDPQEKSELRKKLMTSFEQYYNLKVSRDKKEKGKFKINWDKVVQASGVILEDVLPFIIKLLK